MSSETKPAPLTVAELRRGLIAGLLAWVFPGAGHAYVGARRRALVFFLLYTLALTLGVSTGGNLAVVDGERAPVLSRLKVLTNLALGPVEPILRMSFYGELVYRNSPAKRAAPESLDRRRERAFRRLSTYGSAYLLTAGLMNMLLIFDAWDIAIGRKE